MVTVMKIKNQLLRKLQEENKYSDYEMKQIKYLTSAFVSEASKLLLLAVFFSFLSKLPELAVSVIALLSVRNFMGGIHLKHYSSCLLLSWGIFFMGICVLPYCINLSVLGMMVILVLCLVAVYLIGPVLSPYRTVLTDNQKKSSSLKAATAILIYLTLVFIFQRNSCLYAGFWIIVLQTLQLGLAKIIKQYKKGRFCYEKTVKVSGIFE